MDDTRDGFENSLEGQNPGALLEEIRSLNIRLKEILARGVKIPSEKRKIRAEIARIFDLVKAGWMNLGSEERHALNQLLKYCDSPTTPSN